MALIVQKFGGTSVGTLERIRHVARWALDSLARGDEIVLVISAMSGETNRLVELVTAINPIPYSRDYDMVLASGEQTAVGLVSLAINTEARRRALISDGAYLARPFLGHQVGIFTDSAYSKARIHRIDTELLRREISQGKIPVIAGFQGVDADFHITTLGRGGSDTTAVAIAVALRADDCEIYTDVEGVFTTDPRICPEARKISKISYEQMMELASLGAKVLQTRSVELAAKYRLPLHVRSSFNPEEGTRVVSPEYLEEEMEAIFVVGVAADPDQVKFTLDDIVGQPGLAAQIFGRIAAAGIVMDFATYYQKANGNLTAHFTVGREDHLRARAILGELQRLPAFRSMVMEEERDLAKVSIVGVGLKYHPEVLSKVFALLEEAGVGIKHTASSEIRISCLVENSQVAAAVRGLHQGFHLAPATRAWGNLPESHLSALISSAEEMKNVYEYR